MEYITKFRLMFISEYGMSKKKSPAFILYIQYLFFLLGVGMFRILPLHAAWGLGRFSAWCIVVFGRKLYKRIVRHVMHSGIRTDRTEAEKLARASVLHMVKVFIEVVKFDQIVNEKNFSEFITVADDPVSREMLSPETARQIILATGHIGNWELAGGCISHVTGIPMTSIGRRLQNPWISDYFFRKRCSFEHESFSKEKGLRPLLEAWKKGRDLTIVADQHCVRSEGVEVTFFGHPARAHSTPALLQLKTGLPIGLPYLVRKDDDFHFELRSIGSFTYKPTGNKEADIKAIVQKYTDQIEQVVRQYPEQWLWAHRRWLDCGRRESAQYLAKQNSGTVQSQQE